MALFSYFEVCPTCWVSLKTQTTLNKEVRPGPPFRLFLSDWSALERPICSFEEESVGKKRERNRERERERVAQLLRESILHFVCHP